LLSAAAGSAMRTVTGTIADQVEDQHHAQRKASEVIARNGLSGDRLVSDLLETALEAHGGLESWQKVRRLDARVTLAGYLFELKQHPAGLRTVSVQVETHRPGVRIAPFPVHGRRGIFQDDVVTIQTDGGAVIAQLEHPRDSYEGHLRVTPWSELQFLYFVSNTIWNYLTLPFLLVGPDVHCEEVGTHQSGADTWRVLQATFPETIPTHCPQQRFYFDSDGLLRRHDFFSEIAKGRVTQFCFDTREFDGFYFPTRSRVLGRDGQDQVRTDGPSSYWIELESLVVARD
jgi:hypothetical protein